MPAAANSSPSVPDLQRRVDELTAELRARTSDHEEGLRREAAMAEILQVTNASGGDLARVFDAIIEKATRLCSASYGYIWTYDGESVRPVAVYGDERFEEWLLQRGPVQPGPESPLGRALRSKHPIHVLDATEEETYRSSAPFRDQMDRAGIRTMLHVSLRKDRRLLGVITVYRRERQAFTDQQVRLLESFADQAVIAMENARLLDEQREALERQTATAEVLQVINSSPGELAPVFETMLEKATELCEAKFGALFLYDGTTFAVVADRNLPPAYAEEVRGKLFSAETNTAFRRLLESKASVHIEDMFADASYVEREPLRRAAVELGGVRGLVAVPLLKKGELIGCFSIYRDEPGGFAENQIALVTTFADQAVIAIENARLLDELRQRSAELARSVDELTATGDVLKIISRCSVDLEAVLETLVETVARLCRADHAYMFRGDDEVYQLVAAHGLSDEAREFIRTHPLASDRGTVIGRTALERRAVHISDVLHDPDYTYMEGQKIAGFRTILGIPLMRENTLIGLFNVSRTRVEPFTDKEIELATSFADQAVIAIENARLFEELRDREAELRVTFDNMGDGVVMFDADLKLASWNRNFQELLDVPDSFLAGRPGLEDYVRLLVGRGELGEADADSQVAFYRERASQHWSTERIRPDGRVIEVRNNPVPGGGVVLIYSDITERKEAEEAIRRARDSAEAALERQTATAEVLQVINSSPGDLAPVFDAMLEKATRLCEAKFGNLLLYDGQAFTAVADRNLPPAYAQAIGDGPIRPGPNTALGRMIRTGAPVHVTDMLEDVAYAEREPLRMTTVELGGARSMLAIPLLKEGDLVGAFSIYRREAGGFAENQIALVATFAAQAVIAIQNARLITETREALEQQTATAEILTVISQSPTDVGPVLSAVARAAMKFCGANDALVSLREGDEWVIAAHEGPIETIIGTRRMLTRHTAPGRAMTDGEVVQIRDLQSDEGDEFPEGREIGTRTGFRSALAAPLLRDDVSIGAISLRRREAGEFEPRQVELLKTFAAQAVIAIENVRLFTELRESLERLKAAQANLIQSEKMASLGQLTAGIAHEIKNPLNFVNNFAGLSVELLDELKQAAAPVLVGMSEDERAEFGETVDLITANLEKIAEHGRRADGIVKSMLAHSRGGTGDWQASNINAIVEEALNLAYHGARAQDKDFNVTLERDFAAETRPIEVVPQDVTRVFLNLFGNGFYAAKKRQLSGAGSHYRPTLTVSTRDLGEAVEIRVRDNGTGISPEVRAKLFQPFFTTKPTGEGTGLGLSISYDIVTQQHGGSIDVETEAGGFTEFTVRLPRRRRAA